VLLGLVELQKTAIAMLDDLTKLKIVQAFAAGKTVADVARLCHTSPRAARRWRDRYAETGTLAVLKRTGRKPRMTLQATRAGIGMMLDGKHTGTQQVANELHQQGLTPSSKPVHRTTLVRHAKRVAAQQGKRIRAVRTKPVKQLTADTMAKRLAFCKANRRTNWRHVCFSDRCKFTMDYIGEVFHQVAWVEEGQQRTARKVNRGSVYNVYCVLTPHGMTAPITVAGTTGVKFQYLNQQGGKCANITQQQYHDVCKEMLSMANLKMAANGKSLFKFQQDNDPTHKKPSAKQLEDWNTSHPTQTISLLDNWPPNSLDLSPIENVWGIVKAQVLAKGCNTFLEFKQTVDDALRNIPQSTINKLYDSMRGRIAACVAKHGGKIRH
jgi:transposase